MKNSKVSRTQIASSHPHRPPHTCYTCIHLLIQMTNKMLTVVKNDGKKKYVFQKPQGFIFVCEIGKSFFPNGNIES